MFLIGIGAGLVSCDKSRDVGGSNTDKEFNTRESRHERPPVESQGTRGKMRAALDAAKRLEAFEERDRALTKVGRDALEPAPDLSAEAIRELSAGRLETAGLIEACVAHLMKSSPDEALVWADSLKDAPLVSMAREHVAMWLAETEPLRAIELLGDINPTAGESDQAVEQVLQLWTGKAPQDAATWASRLPAGESRTTGIKTVVSQWLQSDPASSTAWVASLRDPNLRLESTRFMAESLQTFPSFIRDNMLQNADPVIRSEIESQIEQQQPPPEQ